jgi:hypothetical protein
MMTKLAPKFILALATSLLLSMLVVGAVAPSAPPPGTYAMSIVAEDNLPNVPTEIRSNFDGNLELTFAKGKWVLPTVYG